MSKTNKGQGMVEFAMMLPILLMLLIGVVEIGFLAYEAIDLNSDVREICRVAAKTGQNDVRNGKTGTDGIPLSITKIVLDLEPQKQYALRIQYIIIGEKDNEAYLKRAIDERFYRHEEIEWDEINPQPFIDGHQGIIDLYNEREEANFPQETIWIVTDLYKWREAKVFPVNFNLKLHEQTTFRASYTRERVE